MSMRNILTAAGGSAADDKVYVDDVFSAYTRTGTGADVTVPTGIDMTKGYMLWSKGRGAPADHAIYDSARGVMYDLASNLATAQTMQVTGLKAVSTSGHTIGSLAKMNTNAANYVDFVFRKAPKFFDVVTFTTDASADATFSHSLGVSPGVVVIKSLVTTQVWLVWHKDIPKTSYLSLSDTHGVSSMGMDYINPSSTSVSFISNNLLPSRTYVAYLFAHDPSPDGIVQCGSFTTDATGNATVSDIGWEPQYGLFKASATTGNWIIMDQSRGWNMSTMGGALSANGTGPEDPYTVYGNPTATGFYFRGTANTAYIYTVIRRPNKPPTSGTQVYNAIARNGTGAAPVDIAVGFSPDLVSIFHRGSGQYCTWVDKLRGASSQLFTSDSSAEVAGYSGIAQFLPTGVSIYDAPGAADMNQLGYEYINHFFKRAPGVFDVVCYRGTGVARTIPHNLGAVPELMIVKNRTSAMLWGVYSAPTGNTQYMALNAVNAPSSSNDLWNNTTPTASVFSVNTSIFSNTSAENYVAYLFTTKAGISKVGSYTGNGSSQTINCGFTTGARFVLIKRTDSAGAWYIWDTARGIVAGNDPHLSLNTTAAEVTTNDSIDPNASGFIVNQVAATNVNVSGATYLYLAIA